MGDPGYVDEAREWRRAAFETLPATTGQSVVLDYAGESRQIHSTFASRTFGNVIPGSMRAAIELAIDLEYEDPDLSIIPDLGGESQRAQRVAEPMGKGPRQRVLAVVSTELTTDEQRFTRMRND